MDIDTVIEQLHAVMDVKKGGLIDAANAAPKLLQLSRYKRADNPQALLASDIEAAIRRLPPDLANDANNLLPIKHPTSYLSTRWNEIGAAKYSAPAKRWRWTSVFGRVATELIKLYNDDATSLSYHVNHLHIHQVVYAPGPLEETHRLMIFTWDIESRVEDLQWFAFAYSTKNQSYSKWEALDESVAVARIPVADSYDSENHWYIIHMPNSPRANQPVKLCVGIWFGPSSGKEIQPWLEHTLVTSVDKLVLTAHILHSTPSDQFTCSEREAASGKVLNEFVAEIGKTVIPSEIREFDKNDSRPVRFYIPDAPREGHTYRLAWKIDPPCR